MKTMIFILSCLMMVGVYAQDDQLSINYDSWSFATVIEQGEKLVSQGKGTPKTYEQLANSYFHMAKYKKAAKFYAKIFKERQDYPMVYYFRYGQSLKATGKVEEANEYLNKYAESLGEGEAPIYQIDQSEFERYVNMEEKRYALKRLRFNSKYSDFGVSVYDEGLMITSANRDKEAKHFEWNDEPFLDIYKVQGYDINKHGKVQVRKFEFLNTEYHESTPVFTNDGNTAYFTRNTAEPKQKKKRKKKKNKDGGEVQLPPLQIEIYRSHKIDGEWREPELLPFCLKGYSFAHPTLSPDNRTLIFSSNMPGGYGQSDLYMVEVFKSGGFGKPINLGKQINTPQRENFPFIDAAGQLYFASDGHQGMGGLDVFRVVYDEKNRIRGVRNLGKPINSPSDDFAYSEHPENPLVSFVASNRKGGRGSDDIYRFDKKDCETNVSGIVKDRKTGEPIPHAKIELVNQFKEIISTGETYELGYNLKPPCFTIAKVKIYADGYVPYEKEITIGSSDSFHDFFIDRDIRGQDLLSLLRLEPIYFEYDRSNINKHSRKVLKEIAKVMKKHPKIILDIQSHTDIRGTDEHNMELSINRAASTRNYLITLGIGEDRLQAAGHGKTQPVVNCVDKECTEEEHSLNRRSEFIILEH